MRRLLRLLVLTVVTAAACTTPAPAGDDDSDTATVVVSALYRDDDGTVRIRRHRVAAADADALRRRLAAEPDVIVAGTDATSRTQGGPTPRFDLASSDWALDRVGATAAWDAGHTGAGVKVAVVDTGVDATHPDLAGRVSATFSAFDSPATVDPAGHGTHVAGIVAAGRGGPDVTGVAPDAHILAVRVMGADGVGQHSDISAGIIAAVDAGADVVNLSLGGPTSTEILAAGVAYAVDRGVVVVAAAGNENTAVPSYPAAYPGVVAVAATTRGDTRAPFSNTGPHLDLAAPGFAINSTAPGGRTAVLSGTSQAAPFVAGAAALTIDAGTGRHATPGRLAATAGPLGAADQYGAGMVDASAATGGPPTPPGMRLGPPSLDPGRLTPGEMPTPAPLPPLAAPNLGERPAVDLERPAPQPAPVRPVLVGGRLDPSPTLTAPTLAGPPRAPVAVAGGCGDNGMCSVELTLDDRSEVVVTAAGTTLARTSSSGEVQLLWRTLIGAAAVVTVDDVAVAVVAPTRASPRLHTGAGSVRASTFGPPSPVRVEIATLEGGRWVPVRSVHGVGHVTLTVTEPGLVRATATQSGRAQGAESAWRASGGAAN